jgi:chemotaxis protein MotB
MVLMTAALGLTVTLAAGCASDLKQRVTMLEDANANLTDQLNLSLGALDDAQVERDELDRQLMAATVEAEDLRAKLASTPEAEPAAEGWTAVPGGAMIAIEGSVLFAPGRAVLRKESRRILEAIVSTVGGEYADKDILVFGHTDDRPISKSGWADNWQLSTERALSVVRYLKDQAVAPSRLVACGCGEHRPGVPNVSEANRARNRRVEIFAIEPQGSPGR